MAGASGTRRTLVALGLAVPAVAALAASSAACGSGHGANAPGPPFVVAVLAVRPADARGGETLYATTRTGDCPGLVEDGGGAAIGAPVAPTASFRVVLSELIDGDRVEPLDEAGVGAGLAAGIVTVSDPQGGAPVSSLDPQLVLGAGALVGSYQPAGGNGCFGSVSSVDPVTGAPAPGPALLLALAPAIPSLPASTALTLSIDGTVPGHLIVDTGGAALADGVLRVAFTTAPMVVDCPSLAQCNVAPLPDPSILVDPAAVRSVRVGFTTPVGSAAGVALYADATPVPGVVAVVPTDVRFAVDLVAGPAAAPGPLALAAGRTYWVLVTSAVADPWGVPAAAACACADGAERCCDAGCGAATCADGTAGCCVTRCAAAAAAGLATADCLWAGAFTTSGAAPDRARRD